MDDGVGGEDDDVLKLSIEHEHKLKHSGATKIVIKSLAPHKNIPHIVAVNTNKRNSVIAIFVQARNEGRDLATEGNEIIREATKWSPELAACEVWKEIKTFVFEWFLCSLIWIERKKEKISF
ncbi:hypothetical protein QVD17_14160 [Tagetes erecta]|uniref:Uncharacterized protein n=1 Tax=Tagetes erecta TaxID=13708 RepID=A0AAD8L496_TARER|nr:hypothetical protein QVD17_14160 [Tagetes erecta]